MSLLIVTHRGPFELMVTFINDCWRGKKGTYHSCGSLSRLLLELRGGNLPSDHANTKRFVKSRRDFADKKHSIFHFNLSTVLPTVLTGDDLLRMLWGFIWLQHSRTLYFVTSIRFYRWSATLTLQVWKKKHQTASETNRWRDCKRCFFHRKWKQCGINLTGSSKPELLIARCYVNDNRLMIEACILSTIRSNPSPIKIVQRHFSM